MAQHPTATNRAPGSARDATPGSLTPTSLAGTNQFELLLFRLAASTQDGQQALYGINVFKVREIVPMPALSAIAGARGHLMGIAKLRDEVLPVFDLPAVLGHATRTTPYPLMIVTEYARSTQAFAVETVEDIVRLDWEQVTPAQAGGIDGGLITSIARVGTGDAEQLIQVLDVETILQRLLPEKLNETAADIANRVGMVKLDAGAMVLVADDSPTARKLLTQMMAALQMPCEIVHSGRAAWDRLEAISQQAQTDGKPLCDKVPLVLTDIEMPEMDGFTLTRKIKEDPRMAGVRVVINSSLSGSTNAAHVASVGADGYVVKFAPEELGQTIAQALARPSSKGPAPEKAPLGR